MKKIFVLGLVASMFLFGCGSDDDGKTTPGGDNGSGQQGLVVEQTQRSVLWYYTATWCPPCGSTGSPLFKQMTEANGSDELIAIDIHSSNSSGLVPGYIDPADGQPKVAVAMAGQLVQQIRPNGYIPQFTLNNEFQGNSSVNTGNVKSALESYNSNDPLAGVAAEASVDGNTITVKTKTKFFKDGADDYYISVLLLEKDIVAPQNVSGNMVNDFAHKQVLRASLIDGEMYTQKGISVNPIISNVTANTEVEGEYSLNWEKAQLPDGFATWEFDKNNTSAVVIVWKKNGQTYDTVNAIEVGF